MAFKFELVSSRGDSFGSFETPLPSWETGDRVIAAGNVHYRVISVIPLVRLAGYDDPLDGALEVEPL